MTTRPWLVHGLVGIAWGLLATAFAYAALRAVDALTHAPVDPANVLYASEAGLTVRLQIALFAGLLGSFAGGVAARHAPRATARALSVAVPVIALLALLQGATVP